VVRAISSGDLAPAMVEDAYSAVEANDGNSSNTGVVTVVLATSNDVQPERASPEGTAIAEDNSNTLSQMGKTKALAGAACLGVLDALPVAVHPAVWSGDSADGWMGEGHSQLAEEHRSSGSNASFLGHPAIAAQLPGMLYLALGDVVANHSPDNLSPEAFIEALSREYALAREEDAQRYCSGGYAPLCPGDRIGPCEDLSLLKKVGYGTFSTAWLAWSRT
jgi:hypothetical protein